MKRAGGEDVLYDPAAFEPGVSVRSRSGIPPSPAEVGTPALLLTERDLALCAAMNSAEWLRASPSNGILYHCPFFLPTALSEPGLSRVRLLPPRQRGCATD